MMSREAMLADVVSIISTLDVVFEEIDRKIGCPEDLPI
jgi:NADH:ubiquinone oxidoreductase subunit D